MRPSTQPIVLEAVCDILHLGIRRGETVVVFGSAEWPVSVSRQLDAPLARVAAAVANGTLSPASGDDAARLPVLRRAAGGV